MGLRAGEDMTELGGGEFYGFGVDAGTAAFVDASVAADLMDDVSDTPALLEDASVQVGEDDMVLWHSGDGYYPVWIGRDADDEVAAIVADMLVLTAPAAGAVSER